MTRKNLPILLLVGAVLLASCGREAPYFEPHPGALAVRSNPPGAGILLNGLPTGRVTPDTIPALDAGEYVVSVGLPGYTSQPESIIVAVASDLTAIADFVLSAPSTGSIAVTSTPSGAAIQLDGANTGSVTPDTLLALPQGDHVIRVALTGYTSDPESLVVAVASDEQSDADFTLTELPPPAQKILLLESFSNVSCVGCPALAATLDGMMGSRGHGPERVLLIKYSMSWPSATDPMHLANAADNDARMTYYQNFLGGGIPTLVADGALMGASGNPPAYEDLVPAVDQALAEFPGFGITVEAQATGTEISVTATLTSDRHVDLSGCVLNVVVVENPVEFDTPPGTEGETEFHWVMRDFVTAAASLPVLEAGHPLVRTGTLARNNGWLSENLVVIAFVQNAASKAVLQAGSTFGIGIDHPAHSSVGQAFHTSTAGGTSR